jgi:hypothetical protein
MPRIKCHYADCVFIDDGYCSAAAVEIDPDTGCGTYSRSDAAATENAWEDDEDAEGWEEDDAEGEDGEWLDEEEDEV